MMYRLMNALIICLLIGWAGTGCVINDDDSGSNKLNLTSESLSNFIVSVNTDAGWSTGTFSVILEDGTVKEDLVAFNTSDIEARTYNGSIFIMGKFMADWIARIDLSNLKKVVYQIDVKGADSSANPYDMDFAGVHTAYVLRYDADSIWIVDPAPADEANFKKGVIDISAYNTGINVPNAIEGIIVGNMYYVLLERSNDGAYDTTSQVLKIDITDPDNPVILDNVVLDTIGGYHMDIVGDKLYICSWGRLAKSWVPVTRNPNGGIEEVDLGSFSTNGVGVDDGTDGDDNAYDYGGFFNNFVVISSTKGYILVLNWETWPAYAKIVEFNPTTGAVDDAAGNRILENQILSHIALSADRQYVYASVQDSSTPANSGIYTIDVSDNSVTGPVSVGLDPMKFEVNN